MKAAPALALLSLLLLPLLPASAAPPDPGVAAASKKLETARANLTRAVQAIEKDPPNTADLETAHAAVGTLKDAIDAGAEQEAKDLDYARAVLAARKELRTQREYVDQRRANVHIHNHRRVIDAAVTALNERAARTEAKDASAKDFEDARAAAAAVKKAVEEGRQFTKQDPKFATYVTEVDAAVARLQKAFDERWTLQSVDKHRVLVEESREAMATALAALSKTSTDAQFEAADAAASLVSKRLDEGKILEANDKTYRADAERARKELAQAKKRMEEILSETGLARLKAEIEPAHQDLAAAAKGVRARKPTPDQLAEARTAAIVVRKLLEKFQAQTSRSQVLGQYASEVTRTLVEVEVELQKRTLDAARADVTAGLKAIAGKAPTHENFEELKTALVVLEKTLETVHARDPAMAQPAADAKALVRDGRASMASRRMELDVDVQKGALGTARGDVTKALKAIAGKAPTEENFEELKTALTVLEKTLETVNAKAPAMAQPAADAKALLRDARASMASRRTELDVEVQKRALDTARAEVTKAQKAIAGRAPTEENFEELKTALTVLEKTIEGAPPKVPGLLQSVADAKALLREARAAMAGRRSELDVELQKRTLAAAQADVTKGLKTIAGRTPTDENFEELKTALTVLEKTLEGVPAKVPGLLQSVADVKAMLRDSRASMTVRRMEVEVLRQRAKVEEAKKKAAELVKQIAQPNVANDLLQEAEAAVKQIGTVLAEGAALIKKDREYGAYDKEVKERIADLNGRIANRRIALAAGDGRTALNEAITAAKASLGEAKQPEATDAQLEAAAKSLTALGQGIDGRAALEKQDKGYAAQAERGRNEFMRLAEGLELAKQARELRRQTVEALSAGAKAAEAATAAQNLRGQKEQHEKALIQFRSCGSSGANMVNGNRALENAPLFVEGRRTTAKEVIALCVQRAEATDLLLKQVLPLIAFDEGPKKTFEAGKGLLARSKPGDALRQFDECISSGMILQNRNPELKERKFEVAGGSMSLSEVIQQCIAQRKALKGK